MRACNKCEEKFEATKEFFYIDNGSKDGLNYSCKKCCALYAKQNRERIKKARNDYKAGAEHEEVIEQVKPPLFYIDKHYLVKEKQNLRGGWDSAEFKGKCIYQDKRLLTLKSNIGVVETFLKMDFVTGDYSYEELS